MPHQPFNSVEDFATWALEIRATMFDSEASLFFALLEGEQVTCPWKGAFTSFEGVIHKFDLTIANRYTDFKGALAYFDEATIRKLGIDVVIKAAAVQDKTARATVILDATCITESRGCQLTRKEIIRRIQQIAPTPKLTNALKGMARGARDQAEMARMRSLLAQRDREIVRQAREIERLRCLLRSVDIDPDTKRVAPRRGNIKGRSQPVKSTKGRVKRKPSHDGTRPAVP